MLVTLKVKGSGDAYKREGGYRSVFFPVDHCNFQLY